MTSMFGYIGQMVLKVDILGLGAVIPVLGLSLGIALAGSGGKTRNFLLILLMITFIEATVIFITTKDGQYYLCFALALLITIFLPDDGIENVFGVQKEN